MARYKPLRPGGGIDFNGNFRTFKPLGGNLDQLEQTKSLGGVKKPHRDLVSIIIQL